MFNSQFFGLLHGESGALAGNSQEKGIKTESLDFGELWVKIRCSPIVVFDTHDLSSLFLNLFLVNLYNASPVIIVLCEKNNVLESPLLHKIRGVEGREAGTRYTHPEGVRILRNLNGCS